LTAPVFSPEICLLETRGVAAWADDVLGWVSSGALKVHISNRYPLAAAAKAHDDLEGRRTTGKLLLIP
jgi:NADPH:quinone reductase-like Zn-dependent oxidoreductase